MALARIRPGKAWGWFDEPRLLSYDGGSLLLLGKYAAAEELLRLSLKRLDPLRLKHRSTTSADLAMVLALRGEVEESCARADDALTFARAISHRESVDRVRGVHFRLMRWRGIRRSASSPSGLRPRSLSGDDHERRPRVAASGTGSLSRPDRGSQVAEALDKVRAGPQMNW